MNVAGKSLQDIYDAGAKRLEELEEAQKSTLHDTTETHLDERHKVEPESLKQLNERADELEQEIRAYLTVGLERAEKVVVSETAQCEKYISRLVDALGLLSKKFSESISQLRESADSQLTDLSSDNERLYKSAAQNALSQINHEGEGAIDACKTEGMQAHADISRVLDQSWNSILDSEDNVVADLVSTYDSNAEQLTDKFTNCKKRIEDQVGERLSKLELRSMRASESIRETIKRLVETAEKQASDSDVKLKERFSSLLDETSSSFDDASNRAVSDVIGLHESSMADLTMKSQELSREMDSLAESVTKNSSEKREELKDKGSGLVSNYTEELNSRTESSRAFQKDLEQERLAMVSEIWRELSDVRSKFEDKLAGLAKNTLDKMRTICDDAEKAIVTAQHNCANESESHANEKQVAIDTAAREFIKRVEQTRDSALDAIAKAAGAREETDQTPSSLAEAAESDESESETPAEEEQVTENKGAENRRRKKSGKANDKARGR